mmetsp:Transcript_7399/g.8361  ORF Transcript_7399/g.8361 Transcript_7399/m.8361 type:complete len:84 (+) Transcript_7399:74-325(+)
MQSERSRKKKTLVIELNETIVHTLFSCEANADFTFPLVFDDNKYTVSLFKRPYLDQFLSEVSQIFEIIFYTSSIDQLATEIVN